MLLAAQAWPVVYSIFEHGSFVEGMQVAVEKVHDRIRAHLTTHWSSLRAAFRALALTTRAQ